MNSKILKIISAITLILLATYGAIHFSESLQKENEELVSISHTETIYTTSAKIAPLLKDKKFFPVDILPHARAFRLGEEYQNFANMMFENQAKKEHERDILVITLTDGATIIRVRVATEEESHIWMQGQLGLRVFEPIDATMESTSVEVLGLHQILSERKYLTIYSHNDLQRGFEQFIKDNLKVRSFFENKNSGGVVYDKYISLDLSTPDEDNIFEINALEIFLAQESFLKMLNKEKLDMIINRVIENKKIKDENLGLYGEGRSLDLLLLGRVMKAYSYDMSGYEEFLGKGNTLSGEELGYMWEMFVRYKEAVPRHEDRLRSLATNDDFEKARPEDIVVFKAEILAFNADCEFDGTCSYFTNQGLVILSSGGRRQTWQDVYNSGEWKNDLEPGTIVEVRGYKLHDGVYAIESITQELLNEEFYVRKSE